MTKKAALFAGMALAMGLFVPLAMAADEIEFAGTITTVINAQAVPVPGVNVTAHAEDIDVITKKTLSMRQLGKAADSDAAGWYSTLTTLQGDGKDVLRSRPAVWDSYIKITFRKPGYKARGETLWVPDSVNFPAFQYPFSPQLTQ